MAGWTMTRPLKAESPPAPTSRDTLKQISRIRKAYQLRQRMVSERGQAAPRVSPLLAQGEAKQHAKPSTVTNRVAAYRVKAGSIVEPCGRVFHRVEQSPESKECQHLQQALMGLPDRKAYAATAHE